MEMSVNHTVFKGMFPSDAASILYLKKQKGQRVSIMDVAIYARVSTAAQAEHGYSLKTQVEACKQKATELGATSVTEYVDDGYSGAYLERPALDALRDALSAKLHDCVIIYDTDRLARDTMLLLLITEEIEKTASLVYVNTDYNKTPEGQLFYEIKGSFAKYERIRIQDRFNRGRRGKLKSGKPLKEYKIYGYDFVDGHYIVNEKEAEIVKTIYELYLNTAGGHAKIADALYERGIISLSGKKFNAGTIYGILTHSHYTGSYYSYRTYHKKTGTNKCVVIKRDSSEWIKMSCPQIVPQDLFDAVQRKLRANRAKRLRECKYKALFQGVLYCGICGRRMRVTKYVRNGTDYAYYICSANKEKAGSCSNRMSNAEVIDKELWKVVRKICYSEKTLKKYLKDKPLEDNTKEVSRKLDQVAKQRTAIMNWYSTALLTLEECTERLEALKKQELLLKQELNVQTDRTTDIATMIKNARRKDLNYNDKRVFIAQHIAKVLFVRTGGKMDYNITVHIEFQ